MLRSRCGCGEKCRRPPGKPWNLSEQPSNYCFMHTLKMAPIREVRCFWEYHMFPWWRCRTCPAPPPWKHRLHFTYDNLAQLNSKVETSTAFHIMTISPN